MLKTLFFRFMIWLGLIDPDEYDYEGIPPDAEPDIDYDDWPPAA
jgi:hypothetical protein